MTDESKSKKDDPTTSGERKTTWGWIRAGVVVLHRFCLVTAAGANAVVDVDFRNLRPVNACLGTTIQATEHPDRDDSQVIKRAGGHQLTNRKRKYRG